MFKLGDRYLQHDTPFEYNGVRYPSNWLRLSTPEEKNAIGLTEVKDPIILDRRFYMPQDPTGDPIPRDLETVKEEQINAVKLSMKNMLSHTDWVIIRQIDTGQPMSNSIKNYRSAVRDIGSLQIEKIKSSNNIDELREIVTTVDWPDRSQL